MTDKIKELESKILSLQGQNTNPIWSLLDDNTKNLTQQEIDCINNDKSVSKARSKMIDAFVSLFLFAKFRDEFANIPTFKALCEQYVNAIMNVKNKLHKQNIDLITENERLKAEIERLRGNNG